ncbi:MAG: OB-fold nucleic acid binding domain-containing protein [Candidatus Bathyarchaeales archaeon]
MKIRDLRNGMKNVTLEAKVIEKTEAHEVLSRFKDETYKVATAIIEDETGKIKLTLWNEQIGIVKVNDKIKLEKGYVSSFRGELQLNVGRNGVLTVI